MALSPWMAKGRLEIREAAALLAGIRPDEPGLTFSEDANDYNEWRASLVHAAFVGELESDWSGEERNDKQYTKKVTFDPWPQEVWAWVKKSSLHKWLNGKGIPDSDIPIEIRTYPADGHLDAGVSCDDLRALEAFGLLVELYASQHGPDYRHGGRPKASRIVEDMRAAVPDDVPSMGDRKLKQHVGAAIKAWEAKKRR